MCASPLVIMNFSNAFAYFDKCEADETDRALKEKFTLYVIYLTETGIAGH